MDFQTDPLLDLRHAITTMNTITSAHICLLNDFISRTFALISSVVPLSSDAIRKLEDSREGWQHLRARHFSDLLLMTKLVAIGVILEGPELVYEIGKLGRRWRKRNVEDQHADVRAPGWITLVGLVGWILVSIGVAGEFMVDRWVNTADDNIQSINITLLRDANSSASAAAAAVKTAQGSANAAGTVSKTAETTAGKAMELARGVRQEAHSIENDLAETKKRVEDVSKEAGWRVLSPKFGDELKGKPTGVVDLQYSPGDVEAFMFSSEIYDALHNNGWSVNRPKPITPIGPQDPDLPAAMQGGTFGMLCLVTNPKQSLLETGEKTARSAINDAILFSLGRNFGCSTYSDSSLPDDHFKIIVGPRQ